MGLKWIYDKQKDDLPQNIRLVEYCSRLKGYFHYNVNTKFVPLGCKCLKEHENIYTDFNDCDHQKMLLDQSLLSYINGIIFSKKNNTNNIIPEDLINPAKEALINKNY